jgi:hypothetical protein
MGHAKSLMNYNECLIKRETHKLDYESVEGSEKKYSVTDKKGFRN